MAEEVVGTAWVRIRAITTGIASEISDAVDRASVDDEGRSLGERIGTSANDGIKTKLSEGGILIPDNVVTKAADEFGEKMKTGVGRQLGDGQLGDGIDTPVNRSRFGAIGDKFGSLLSRELSKADNRERAKHQTQVERQIKTFFTRISKFKVPAPIWAGYFGLPLIVGLAKTATFYLGGLVARTGALLQGMAGLGAVAGGLFVQTAGIAGLLVAAFKTETPELTRFQDTMKATAKTWREVAIATQGPLFSGISEGFSRVTAGLVPIFRDLGFQVGVVANNTAYAVSTLLTSERGIRMFDGFRTSTAETAGNLGRLITALVRGVIPLLDAVNPLATRLSASLADMVEHWADLLEAGSDSGSLQRTLDQWYQTGVQVTQSFSNIFKGLWNILMLGADTTGLGALDRFEDFAGRFRLWTESIKGENAIKRFFEEAEPVIQEVNGLIADIFRLFFQGVDTGTGSDNIVGILKQLRSEIIPKVAEGIKSIADSFTGEGGENGSKLVSVLGDLLDAFVRSETLIPTIQVFTFLLEAFAKVLSIPVVGDLIGTVLAMSAGLRILKAVGLVSLGTSLGILGGQLGFFGGTVAKLMGPESDIAKNHKFITALSNALGGEGLASSFGEAALAAAPLVAALALVVGILAGLYFTLQPVRDLLDGIADNFRALFEAIKGGNILEALKQLGIIMVKTLWFPVLLGIAIVRGVWDKIKGIIFELPGYIADAASTFWDWLLAAPEKLGGFIDTVETFLTGLPGLILGWLSGAGDALFGWLQDAIPAVGEKLGGWFDVVEETLKGLPAKVLGWLADAGSALVQWIIDTVPKLPYYIGYFIGALLVLLVALPVLLVAKLLVAGLALVGWIIDAVGGLVANFGTWAGNLFALIAGFVIELPGRIVGAIQGIIGWLVEAIPAMAEKWVAWITSVWSFVTNFVSELPGRISGAVENVTSWLINAIPVLAERWGSVMSNIWSFITNFIAELPGRISGAIDAILGWIVDAASQVPGKMVEFGNGIMTYLQDLPGKILGWIGDLSSTLFNIGRDLIQGFIDGIGDMFDSVKDKLGSLTDALTGWKGPPARDRVLLRPTGRMIMQGFQAGLEDEFANTKSLLQGFTDDISGAFSGNALTSAASLTARQILSASSVSTTPNVALTVKIGDRDITDIVDTQVDTRNTELARQLTARKP